METMEGISQRADEIFQANLMTIRKRTDRLFAGLLFGQWIFGILLAIFLSPYAWAGRSRSIHEHVYAAVFLGGVISLPPILLVLKRPGDEVTRYMVACAQMMSGALLIHLTGGRIETHFHVFGSLAFIAFYRDWKVLVVATVIVAADHLLRQLFWPESVFGLSNPESWRWLEHAGWVVFEDIFLIPSCFLALRDLKRMSLFQQVNLEMALKDKDLAQAESTVKSKFLANMSHEIRTPLNGVIGMAELLSRTDLNAKQLHYVRTLKASGTGLLSIINDILDLSKIEAGKMELRTEEFELHSVVRAVADMMSALAQAKGLEVVASVPLTLPATVAGDADKLRQVLTNLVGNAVKFTEHGYVKISVQIAQRGGALLFVRFEVIDSGVGIAENQIGGLFQAFSQIESSGSRKFAGTGLGLAISKSLVELMGGEIGVTSKPGHGSTFWFTVPLEERYASASTRVNASVSATKLAGKRVLIVDDLETNLTILKEHASYWKMEAVCTTSALKGIALLDEAVRAAKPFDLVITDEQMPEMDGPVMARTIRGMPAISGTLIVMLTSATPDAREAAAGAVTATITKPVLAEELERVLVAVLHRAGAKYSVPPPALIPTPLGRPASEVWVLVAEDNPVNQEVARELIEQLGYAVDIVANGLEALAAIATKRYSVVLMDCQMPKMNGYAAATELRKREAAQGGAHLPIIAATAQAMTGDRERAIAAGMDDYLPKPLDPEKLAEILHQWTGSVASVPNASPPVPIEGPLNTKVRRSPRVGSIFLGQLPLSLAQLRACCDALAQDDLKAEAHKLKGSALSIGAPRLAELCAELENTPFEGVEEVLYRLESEAEAVRSALALELGNNRQQITGLA